MRDIRIETFSSLDDAVMWIERALYEAALDNGDVKGELSYINWQWRASVITDTGQLEFDL